MNDDELTPEQISSYLVQISTMSHIQMAHKWRFAECGDPMFDRRYPLFEAFDKRFKEFGGFTPEISKAIGWTK
jgi:hypothetical protein